MSDNPVIRMHVDGGEDPGSCVLASNLARSTNPLYMSVQSIGDVRRVAADHGYPYDSITWSPGAEEKLKEIEETSAGIPPVHEGAQSYLAKDN